jgi:hypothetical protein
MHPFKMLSFASIGGMRFSSQRFTNKSMLRRQTIEGNLVQSILHSTYCSMIQNSGSIPQRGGVFLRRNMEMEVTFTLSKLMHYA